MITIQEAENKVAMIKGSIDANAAQVSATEGRLAVAMARVKTVKAESDALRVKRQGALADGEDTTELNTKIKSLAEADGLLEDEIVGLSRRIAKLKMEGENLGYELRDAEIKVPQVKSIELATQYNMLAAQLAAVVMRLNDVHDAISDEKQVIFWKKDEAGALKRIPKIIFSPNDALTAGAFNEAHGHSPINLVHSYHDDAISKTVYYCHALYQRKKNAAKMNGQKEVINPFPTS